jgi:hypothetical protein
MNLRRSTVRALTVALLLPGLHGAASEGTAAAAVRARDSKAASARADDLVAARWKTVKDLTVAPRSDDAEFLRRVTLDLTGTIPTEAETVAFLADASPDKRRDVVDRLLATERHGDWFATWYGNLLVGTAMRNRTINRRTFNDWLRDQFHRNRPYDEMVYDLISASGNSDENGAVGFVSSFETSAADAAGKTSRFFLGVQVQCAQCHDHPYDKRIKQADFASFAAFWFTTTHRRNQTPGNPDISFDIASWPLEDLRGGRPRTAGMPGMGRPGQPLRLEAAQPKPGRGPLDVPEAKFLLGKTVKDVPGVDRRTLLAKWVTSRQNPWFAQAFANRLWAWFLGRGIVHPVDDFSSSNKPTNPELIDFLGNEFEASGFDVRHLIRVIVGTEAYQRTSRLPRDMERPDPSLYAVGSVRPLSVEQSFDALFRATGFEREVERRLDRVRRDGAGRAALVDPRMLIYQQFRRSFDDDEQSEEEAFTGTIPRGLLMMNGDQVNRMMSLDNGDSPLAAILRAERGDRERVRRAYLTVLSREPSPGELSNALQHVHTSRTEREGYEDLLWALCNTTEFMSNH